MNELALYEILRGTWADGSPVVPTEPGNRVRSITEHLGRLLNGRQNALTHLPDYGLPDLSAMIYALPGSKISLRDAVSECVERFEPRLNDVEVLDVVHDRAGEPAVTFQIRARVVDGEKVAFDTRISRGGDARVNVGTIR